MDVGLLLPYLLWALVLIDEHYAMWFIFFFIIPLLDVMFYVETPTINEFCTDYWFWLCIWMWFPSVFFCMMNSSFSWQNMFSLGILYNTLMCVADELTHCPYGHIMERMIGDYLGFVRIESVSSVLRSIGFFYIFILNDHLLWHLGSIAIGSLLYEYVHWIENQEFASVSHYGLSNYAMFHFHGKLLPISHVWAFFYLENGLKT